GAPAPAAEPPRHRPPAGGSVAVAAEAPRPVGELPLALVELVEVDDRRDEVVAGEEAGRGTRAVERVGREHHRGGRVGALLARREVVLLRVDDAGPVP